MFSISCDDDTTQSYDQETTVFTFEVHILVIECDKALSFPLQSIHSFKNISSRFSSFNSLLFRSEVVINKT